MATEFQQQLVGAAYEWTDAESCYTDAGRCGTDKEMRQEDKRREEAKAKFEALVERAVDKDAPLVKQTIDSIYLKALQEAVMFIDDELKDYRRPEIHSEYWVNKAENDK